MFEYEYIHLMEELLDHGEKVETRSGPVRKMFGLNLRFDTRHAPVLQSRRSHFKGIAGEYAAFLNGIKHIDDFKKFGCNYWDSWADDNGDIRVDYGNLWRDWDGINQIDQVIEGIRKDPHGRRHIINAWNPGNLDSLSLPCCHYNYQFYVRENKYLDLLWYQRSADWCVGVPADAMLAAIMLTTFAHQTYLEPGEVHMQFGDAHIYENHVEQAELQCKIFEEIEIQDVDWHIMYPASIYLFNPEMVVIKDYNPQESIRYELNI